MGQRKRKRRSGKPRRDHSTPPASRAPPELSESSAPPVLAPLRADLDDGALRWALVPLHLLLTLSLAMFAMFIAVLLDLKTVPRSDIAGMLWAFAAVCTLVVVFTRWGPSGDELLVDASGVTERHWGSTWRTTPFDDIAALRLDGGCLSIQRRNGEWRSRQLAGREILRAEEIRARIQAALVQPERPVARVLPAPRKVAAARPSVAPAPPAWEAAPTLLDRGGRSLGEWKRRLAELARQAPDYRSVGLSRDELAAVLASARASTEQRIGAALALLATGDRGARERVRVVAETHEDDAVRDALTLALRDDLDEEALVRATRDRMAR